MQILIRLTEDELAGKGVFAGRKAAGVRRSTLLQQIKAWEALIEKLEAANE